MKIKISGPHGENIVQLKDKNIIGRGKSCDIRLEDKTISSEHATIKIKGEKLYIEDLHSSNGTFINKKRISKPWVIKGDSSISIGPFTLSIHQNNEDELQEDEFEFNPFRFVRPFLEPVQKYLDDDTVSEIMINSPDHIFIERSGKLERVPERFSGKKGLIAAAKNIGRAIDRDVSEKSPILDARLEDGSRVCIILPPCSLDGSTIAIRKFFKKKLSMKKLIEFGSITEEAVELLESIILLKKNLIVSGGTGSGKTSLLNAISSMVPDDERIVVIEDSAELQLQKTHVVRLEVRQEDEKGLHGVSIRKLLKATLRLRPDRIVIGEIRGGEAFDLLQAMNTGHGGSMSTIHSNSPRYTMLRLENTAQMSKENLPHFAIKQQVASTIDIVVHTSRYPDGSRKISHISEILGLDSNEDYIVKHLFVFRVKGYENGKIIGHHEFTGNQPTFMDEMRDFGIKIPDFLQKA